MSVTKGCLGVVLFGANVVGEVKSWEGGEVSTRRENSIMGTCTKRHSVDPTEIDGAIECYFDLADAAQAAMVVAGTETDITYRPGGTGAGLPQLLYSNCVIESRRFRADVAGDAEGSYTWFCNGTLNTTPQ